MTPIPHFRSFAAWPAFVVLAWPVVAAAADPGEEQPRRQPRRSHIQSVAEIAAGASEHDVDLGIRLSRASTVLRQQLALSRGAGLVVEDVMPGSRGARAGFRQHDVLVMLDDQLLLLPEQLAALVEADSGESPMVCTVLRGGRAMTLPLRDAGQPAAAVSSAGLRPTDSALAIVRESGGTPRKDALERPRTKVGRLDVAPIELR